MKSIPFLIMLLFLVPPLKGFSQTYGTEELDPEVEEQLMAEEEYFMGQDEVSVPSEIERQEDVLHPEGENTDWSLGNEELPVEEYQ
jgi:hypothetical protein